MSVSSISNGGLSTLLPNSSDDEKLLRRSTRRRRKSYWLQTSSDLEPVTLIGSKSSPLGKDSIQTNCMADVQMDSESPVSNNKRTRRRSLAVHDGSILLGSVNTERSNISSLSSMSNNCDDQVETEAISLIPIHSAKQKENKEDDQILTTTDISLLNGKGGKPRRSARRRSLAVHNGSLLLGTSSNINSDILSSTPNDITKKSDTSDRVISKSHQISMISNHQTRNNHQESVQESPSTFSKVCNDVTNATLSDRESSKDQSSSKTSPISITSDVEIRQSQSSVTCEMIKSTMNRYFGTSISVTKPYVTPRLFACVICLLEQQYSYVDPNHPFIALFKAYVGAEVASLRDLDIKSESCMKKIHFCSYDMSSMITPIDTVEDSNLIVENCIDALHRIIEVINDLSCMKNDNLTEILYTSINVLRRIHHNDELLASSCAKAMPSHWPAGRMANASVLFISEFNSISKMIAVNSKDEIASSHLLIRKSLGDLVGRAIKFYLRRFFNPVPLPLYSDSTDLPDYSSSRSIIHALIELKDPEGDGHRDTATADGCISSVFGLALQKMNAFISLNEKLRNGDEKYFTSFCSRAATTRGLKVKDRVIRLNNDDIKDVLTDIEESHIFLAGIRASKFIYSLLSWPGVAAAIEDVGGWGKVESLASLFHSLELSVEMPEEAHLTLLRNIEDLENLCKSNEKELDELELNVVESLRLVWKRFKCGSRNRELLDLNPCIKQIQIELKSGKNTHFPVIVNASLE